MVYFRGGWHWRSKVSEQESPNAQATRAAAFPGVEAATRWNILGSWCLSHQHGGCCISILHDVVGCVSCVVLWMPSTVSSLFLCFALFPSLLTECSIGSSHSCWKMGLLVGGPGVYEWHEWVVSMGQTSLVPTDATDWWYPLSLRSSANSPFYTNDWDNCQDSVSASEFMLYKSTFLRLNFTPNSVFKAQNMGEMPICRSLNSFGPPHRMRSPHICNNALLPALPILDGKLLQALGDGEMVGGS